MDGLFEIRKAMSSMNEEPAKTKTKRQEFLCDECGLESHIDLNPTDDVYTNCQLIKANHQKWSPECNGDLSTIRLLDRAVPERPRSRSKKQRIEDELRESDLTAQLADRQDIIYGHHDSLPRGEHVARLNRTK